MSSYIQIVDQNDELVTHKENSHVDRVNDIYRVSALWLTSLEGDVLIAQRKLTKAHDPGKWGPAVSGTVEQEETYESNMYKEAEEEIGLSGVRLSAGPKTHIKEPWHYFCQWFTCEIDKQSHKLSLQDEEVEAIAWVPFDDLAKEVIDNPSKFVPGFSDIIQLFAGVRR